MTEFIEYFLNMAFYSSVIFICFHIILFATELVLWAILTFIAILARVWYYYTDNGEKS